MNAHEQPPPLVLSSRRGRSSKRLLVGQTRSAMDDESRELTRRMREALDVVTSDRFAEAQAAFERLLADSVAIDDHSLPEVCSAFAALQHKVGRIDDALALHERALREAQRQND